jgi:hypothetical protein
VNGIDDPTTPDTARSLIETLVPTSSFLGSSGDGLFLMRQGEDYRVTGSASDGSRSGPQPGTRAAAAKAFDPAAAAKLRRVEVAVLREGSRCDWLRGPRGGFKTLKPDGGKCNQAVWLRATGLRRWRFDLPAGMPAGRYVMYTRAVNGAGISDTSFSVREKNKAFLVVR